MFMILAACQFAITDLHPGGEPQPVDPAEAACAAAQVAEWDKGLRREAAALGGKPIEGRIEPELPSRERVDRARDPWVPVTRECVREANTDIWSEKPAYSLRASVDYDRDGHPDVAELVNNSRQGGVRVTFGGPKRRAPVMAMTSDTQLLGGQEILAAGRHRIPWNNPEVNSALLFMHRGRPSFVLYGD